MPVPGDECTFEREPSVILGHGNNRRSGAHQDAASDVTHIRIWILPKFPIKDDDIGKHCSVANAVNEIPGGISPVPRHIFMLKTGFEHDFVAALAFAFIADQGCRSNAQRVIFTDHCRR